MHIIGACISPYSSGLYMCDEAMLSPFANDGGFIDWLASTCNEKKVDIVFSGVEEILIEISKNINFLRSGTKAVFVVSEYEKLVIGQDKYKTCAWLQENHCNYPRYCLLTNGSDVRRLVKDIGYPVIIKPIRGKSSQGVKVLANEEELNAVIGLDGYVLEECIGNESGEYTVGCYCDKGGNAQDIIIMQRLLKNGTTVYAKVVENELIRAEAERICTAFKPVGPLNIQMRLNGGGVPICFELNVRFSGSTAMRANFGFCDVEAAIREYLLGNSIDECFHVRHGEAFRYDNELYLFGNPTEAMSKDKKINSMAAFAVTYDCSL